MTKYQRVVTRDSVHNMPTFVRASVSTTECKQQQVCKVHSTRHVYNLHAAHFAH